jgi:DNA-binding MarR family transcriptional regulator
MGVGMEFSRAEGRELQILEQIEDNPDVTQADLAEMLGVAVGTVNFTVRRLVRKGYIRVKQLERRRLRYIITPEGIALRSRLAVDSLKYSMRLYRETRQQAKTLLEHVQASGYVHVVIQGDGDLADIVNLTRLELGLELGEEGEHMPVLSVDGADLLLEMPSQVSGHSVSELRKVGG